MHRPLDVLIAQKAQKEESKTAFLFQTVDKAPSCEGAFLVS